MNVKKSADKMRPAQGKDSVKTAFIVFVCILINYFGKNLAVRLNLPLWLDAFGTVISAYVLGPVCGAIVGASGNIVFAIDNPTSLIYGITSIFIGISVGYMAKKGYFETFFHAMSVAGVVTIVSVLISATLNKIFYNGSTGNIWGDGVKDFLKERGYPHLVGVIMGEFYLDFLDKLVTILSVYFCIKIIRFFRNKKRYAVKKKELTLLLCILLGSRMAADFSLQVRAEDRMDTDDIPFSYVQTIYNSDNGLPCGNANDIAQTNDGILWIGTYAGLYRYNGSEFRLMNEYDSVRNVNCLYIDEEGRLWIGTNDNGVVITINGDIVNVLDSNDGLPSDSVRCIVQSTDGEYYIGTSNSMLVLSLKTGISNLGTIPEVNYAFSSTADKKGYVATVTSDGRLYLLKDRQVVASLLLPEEEGSFSCVTFHENGLLYAGTSKGKILIYDVSEGKFKEKEEVVCADFSILNEIYFREDGNTYVCADNGIGIISGEGTFVKIETGGFNNSVQNMDIDYQGNLWFASSRHGLLRLSASRFANLYREAGLEAKVVNTTAIRKKLLYVGTDNGLDIIELDSKKSISNDLTELLEETRIRCIITDSSGHLWICTYGKGLIEVDTSGKVKNYNQQEGGVGDRVRLCMELSDKTIAVGGDNGISFIKDGEVESVIPYGDKLGFAQILCLLEMPDGRLLAGTDGNGIAVIKDGKIEKMITREDGLSSGVILRIIPDTDKSHVFIVTSNGLCYMDDNGSRFLSNFPYYNNYDVYMDEDGEMFVLGSAGIYIINRDELLSENIPEYNILNSKMGLSGSLTVNAWNGIDEDKNLYLSTDRGVFIVNTDSYLWNSGSYRIILSHILLDGEAYPIERGEALSVARDVNIIEIVPEIINYTREDPEISYYLEGVDLEPRIIPLSEFSGTSYTNLPSGRYAFHLAILDSGTGEMIEESVYEFVKEKSIYDNRWFVFYMVVVAGIFIGWLSWFITRTQIQRTLELQQSKLKLALQQVQMGNETILAIARTVDAKDVLTSKHSQRVSEYSVLIARELGFKEEELENLRRAALLHDIGKIGIPDSILNKPAKLTDEEYAVMKSHVMIGAEILKDFTLIDHVVEGARYHHERYDGHGYPDGLKGEEIPLYGRIIAVVDAFDAMTANRVYRKKLDFDFVVGEMQRCKGTQFDPELLEIFLKLIEDGKIDVNSLYEENTRQNQGGEADD